MRGRLLVRWFLLGAGGLLGTAALAPAQAPSLSQLEAFAQREFDRRDRDKDGALNAREAPDNIRDDLARWDTNKNDKISLLEFKRYLHAQARDRLAREIQRWAPVAAGEGAEFERTTGEDFRRRDRDRNGLLSEREAPDSLRDNFARWDASRDRQIDLVEFKTYVRDRAQERLSEETQRMKGMEKWAVAVVVLDGVEERDVAVYRAGQMPEGVPSWFPELDTNRDAQVSLAEWLRGGKPASEFAEMDSNDDGLLTVEELLRHERLKAGPDAEEDSGIVLPLKLIGGP
jgi:hypothetical protein